MLTYYDAGNCRVCKQSGCAKRCKKKVGECKVKFKCKSCRRDCLKRCKPCEEDPLLSVLSLEDESDDATDPEGVVNKGFKILNNGLRDIRNEATDHEGVLIKVFETLVNESKVPLLTLLSFLEGERNCRAEAIRVSGAVHESFFEHCLLLGRPKPPRD